MVRRKDYWVPDTLYKPVPFISQIKGYLNFDMIGRNNKPQQPMHVVYFYTEANPTFGKWLKEDIKKYNLQLEPDYRPWDNPHRR